MNQVKEPPKLKKFSLSNEEFSQLAFFEEHRKAKELEYIFWVNEINKIKEGIYKRLAIDPHKNQVDWSQVWHNGELLVFEGISPSPIIGVDPKLKEEAKKGEGNGSPELQEKPEQGVSSPKPKKE